MTLTAMTLRRPPLLPPLQAASASAKMPPHLLLLNLLLLCHRSCRVMRPPSRPKSSSKAFRLTRMSRAFASSLESVERSRCWMCQRSRTADAAVVLRASRTHLWKRQKLRLLSMGRMSADALLALSLHGHHVPAKEALAPLTPSRRLQFLWATCLLMQTRTGCVVFSKAAARLFLCALQLTARLATLAALVTLSSPTLRARALRLSSQGHSSTAARSVATTLVGVLAAVIAHPSEAGAAAVVGAAALAAAGVEALVAETAAAEVALVVGVAADAAASVETVVVVAVVVAAALRGRSARRACASSLAQRCHLTKCSIQIAFTQQPGLTHPSTPACSCGDEVAAVNVRLVI